MKAAQRLNVTGFVRNLPNGDVEAHAEGVDESLQQFRRELERGPGMALVTEVIESEIPISGTYTSFLIRG
jgi:acylphosphatase